MALPSQKIQVVDPDEDFLEWAKKHLTASNITFITSQNTEEAWEHYQQHQPDLLISEVQIKVNGGIELLRKVRQFNPNAMVIMTTGFPSTNAVIEAMKLGAYDFLRKEALAYDLRPVAEGALEAAGAMLSTKNLPSEPGPSLAEMKDTIIGKSAAMQDVFKMIGRVSRADAPVMITGESGCGKEVVAQAIHRFSFRTKKDFVAINCAAIPGNLLESELFGHERGAFTGAATQRIGRFEQCDGGTLFLDEIGDMPIEVQSKLLRVLQEGEFSRVGGNETLSTNVRILAATNKDLENEVAIQGFREDLFYRLNVVRIHLPPLRQRREDIPLLADFFLQRIAAKRGIPRQKFAAEAMELLHAYNWPGNVRELENTIQRATVLATTNVLLPKDIPLGNVSKLNETKVPESESAETHSEKVDLDSAIDILFAEAERNSELQLLPWLEKEMTQRAINRTNGNQVQASKLLGITRSTLRKRLEKFEISPC